MSDQYKHRSGLCFTEGIHWLCTQGSCWWWLDLIASYQGVKRVRGEEFQVWRLVVDPIDRSAVATMTNGGTGNDDADKPIVSQRIPWTDYAQDEIETWVVSGVAMQPCEY